MKAKIITKSFKIREKTWQRFWKVCRDEHLTLSGAIRAAIVAFTKKERKSQAKK